MNPHESPLNHIVNHLLIATLTIPIFCKIEGGAAGSLRAVGKDTVQDLDLGTEVRALGLLSQPRRRHIKGKGTVRAKAGNGSTCHSDRR
jgi:hypothetical protein